MRPYPFTNENKPTGYILRANALARGVDEVGEVSGEASRTLSARRMLA
jgi:hypothetical protein